MPPIEHFRLPDAGEGLTEAEIVTWRVAPGDTVAVNDPVVEIETAKSLVELPSPFAGLVTQLLAPVGATVAVGSPIIAIDTGGPAGATSGAEPSTSAEPPPVATPQAEPARTAVLVGYGPRTTAAVRRPRRPQAGPSAVPATAPVAAAPV